MTLKITRTVGEAIAQGYVVRRAHRRQDYEVSNGFYRHCERTDAPYVCIRPKTKYARVEVDLIGQSYRMGGQCLREMRALLLQYHVGRASLLDASLSNELVYSNRIPIGDAAAVAKGLINILAKPGYREPLLYSVSPEVRAVDDALRDGTLV